MPLPNVVANPGPPGPSPRLSGIAGGATRRPSIFISYSHDDLRHADDFLEALRNALAAGQDLPFRFSDIYFDRDRITAGDRWPREIQYHLHRSALLVALISSPYLSSGYCIPYEVDVACSLGIRVIPVILGPCSWEKRSIGHGRQRETLGTLHAVPRRNNRVHPVFLWRLRDEAWTQAAEEVVKRIAALGQLPACGPRAVVERQVPPLLPIHRFSCNQDAQHRAVTNRLKDWNGTSVVVLKGLADDQAVGFARWLQLESLASLGSNLNGHGLLPVRPFEMPADAELDSMLDGELEQVILAVLSKALSSDGYQDFFADPARLAEFLAQEKGVRPLLWILQDAPVERVRRTFENLVGVLEKCPPETALGRLLFCFILEEGFRNHWTELGEALERSASPRLRVANLPPLEAFNDEEVTQWCRKWRVEAGAAIDDAALKAALFNESRQSVRFSQFESALRDLRLISH